MWKEFEHRLFFYDDQNEIGSTDRNGNIQELRILGLSSQAERGAAIIVQLENSIYVPLHDLQGNVASLMALDGTVVQSSIYSAFAEERMSGKCNLINPWRYASKRKDNETSLVYFGRRYYDPDMGRWLTPDPQGFSNGLNLYAYVLNDPLTRIDLYGLEAVNGNRSGWWDRAGNNCNNFREFVGRTIENFFFHCVPIPIVRQVGQVIGNLMRPCHGRIGRGTSAVGWVGDGDLSRNALVIANNGMDHSREEGRAMAQKVSDSIGGKRVAYVYNASHGVVLDLLECAMEKLGFQTHASRLLTRTLREHSDRVGPNGSLAIISHSEGGIHAKNAIHRVNPTVRSRIRAYTFGSGALFDGKGTAYTRHYVSSRDPIMLCSPIELCKSRFSNNSNVEILKSKGGSPLENHGFMNNTYQTQLGVVGKSLVSCITSPFISKIEKGTKLRVKNITWYDKIFVGRHLNVLVQIDEGPWCKAGPKFYNPAKKEIDAHHLLVDYPRTAYNDELARFDPDCLQNVELTLIRAVQYGNLDKVKSFVERSVDPNQRDLDGRTPLHFARQQDIAQYLLEKGADPNLTDKWGKAPLHYIEKSHIKNRMNLEVARLLIDQMDNLDQKDDEGETPLLIALDARNLDIAKLLLILGADPLQKNKDGETPLHAACMNNALNMVEWLVHKKADIHAVDNSGWTALHYACRRSDRDINIIRLLLENGASPDQPNSEGVTPLQLAEQCGNSEAVSLLIVARKQG